MADDELTRPGLFYAEQLRLPGTEEDIAWLVRDRVKKTREIYFESEEFRSQFFGGLPDDTLVRYRGNDWDLGTLRPHLVDLGGYREVIVGPGSFDKRFFEIFEQFPSERR